MLNSLRGRLLISYLVLVAITVSVIATALFALLLNNPLNQAQTYRHLADIAHANELYVNAASPGQIDQRLADIAASNDVRVIRLGTDNQVEYDSAAILAVGSSPKIRIIAGTALDGSRRGILVDPLGQEWLAVSLRPGPGKSSAGRFLIATPRVRVRLLTGVFGDVALPMLEAGLLGVFLSVVFAVVISNWIISPLSRVASAARTIAGGDYSRRAPETGPLEIQSTARAFNTMIDQVTRSREMQRDFLANVSHELKTPLTSIQGFAQAILDAAAADPTTAARVIYDEAGRMRRLVEDLLDLAKIESGQASFHRQVVYINDVVGAVVQKLELRAQQQQVSLKAYPGDIPVITGDADRLAQVFTNLLDNALIHTPAGGCVSISTRHQVGMVEVEISDTGKGIQPDDLERVFERFYQADKSRARSANTGTGLGLTICKEIVLAHGGLIHARNANGHGAVFSVLLPLPRTSDETVKASRF